MPARSVLAFFCIFSRNMIFAGLIHSAQAVEPKMKKANL
jgi:hypothetical protein